MSRFDSSTSEKPVVQESEVQPAQAPDLGALSTASKLEIIERWDARTAKLKASVFAM